MAPELEGWLSAAEAARYLDVSRPRVHQLVRAGVLEGTRVGGRLLVHRTSLDLLARTRGDRSAWRPRSLRELRFKRSDILALAAEHGVRNVRVFGSVARDEGGFSSDVDLAVDLDMGRTALDVAEFAVDLEDILGCPVDVIVVSPAHGSSAATARILSDAVQL
ncbi:MAG TPA: helix-turn-helix domain-containing protein [Candidatus Dormibacteraeota bacterium]